jgi:hypothetical protein
MVAVYAEADEEAEPTRRSTAKQRVVDTDTRCRRVEDVVRDGAWTLVRGRGGREGVVRSEEEVRQYGCSDGGFGGCDAGGDRSD